MNSKDYLENYRRTQLTISACELSGELEKIEELNKILVDIQGVVNQLAPSEQLLVSLRYIKGFPWSQVFRAMEKTGMYYSERQIYRFHKKALAAVQKIITEKEGTKNGDYLRKDRRKD